FYQVGSVAVEMRVEVAHSAGAENHDPTPAREAIAYLEHDASGRRPYRRALGSEDVLTLVIAAASPQSAVGIGDLADDDAFDRHDQYAIGLACQPRQVGR